MDSLYSEAFSPRSNAMKRFSIRTLLIVIALVSIWLGVVRPIQIFKAKQRSTLSDLDWNNGKAGENEMRALASDAVRNLSAFSPDIPNLVSVQMRTGDGRYIVTAYWVGHSHVADGLRLTYSNGESVNSRFSTVMMDDAFDGYENLLFYWGSVYSDRLPDSFNELQAETLISAQLISGHSPCSSSEKPMEY